MIINHRTVFLLFLLLFGFFLIAPSRSFSAGGHSDAEMLHKAKAKEDEIPKYFVPPPPFSEGIFPCSDCHGEMEPNPERRELEEMHTTIHLKHAGPEQWCTDCHDLKNRDKLHLINGKLIDFDELYYLCGQCHGTIFRDWKAGVHGKRTGQWNGKKIYRLCTHCHNPHQPHFKPLKPKHPPERPSDIK